MKNNLGLIPSCLWVTTSSMFLQLDFISTHAVYTLCSVFRSFWHICGMESTDGEGHLALLSISQAYPSVWSADALSLWG